MLCKARRSCNRASAMVTYQCTTTAWLQAMHKVSVDHPFPHATRRRIQKMPRCVPAGWTRWLHCRTTSRCVCCMLGSAMFSHACDAQGLRYMHARVHLRRWMGFTRQRRRSAKACPACSAEASPPPTQAQLSLGLRSSCCTPTCVWPMHQSIGDACMTRAGAALQRQLGSMAGCQLEQCNITAVR